MYRPVISAGPSTMNCDDPRQLADAVIVMSKSRLKHRKTTLKMNQRSQANENLRDDRHDDCNINIHPHPP